MSQMHAHPGSGGRRFAYLLIAGACILGLLDPGGAVAAGSQATPPAPIAAYPDSLRYDLAAMVLPAEEFPVEGLASARGRLFGPEQEAENLAPVLDMEPDALLDELEEIGWTARYLGDVGLPDADDPALYAVAGASYVTEYTDEGWQDLR